MRACIITCLLFALVSFSTSCQSTKNIPNDGTQKVLELVVLGIAQDAGFPQADCKKSCCLSTWADLSLRKMVSCLGIRDYANNKVYMFDATPDFKDQLHILKSGMVNPDIGGVFLSHAHMGHYTGLLDLGREAMGTYQVPVYTMPRLSVFLQDNGPWSQLVQLNNIIIKGMTDQKKNSLGSELSVTPILVPHRDEFSETVGFLIQSATKKILFIPDIDKWNLWDRDINDLIAEVDYAFLDGTFFRNGEIWGRDMSEIPHPFIEESMSHFEKLSDENKQKVHFIHLNHTNPLLDLNSVEYHSFSKSLFNLAEEGMIIDLRN